MTTRILWSLVLKTLGMWLIINGLISLPGIIYGISNILTSPFSLTSITIEIAYLTLITVFYFLIFQFLILKSKWTVDFLQLEKGFEETRINLTISYSKLLKIIIILIGGVLFARAIPNLVENLYSFITDDVLLSQSPKTINMIIHSMQVIISFLIMTNSDLVQRYINKKGGEAEVIG